MCCTYGSLNPIFREASACGWAGSVRPDNRSSLPLCTKLVVAPIGHVVALQLPSQEQPDVVVAVYDGLTAVPPMLRPTDGSVWSSGRHLLLVLESTRNTSLCGKEATWRAKIFLEEQRSATTQKSVVQTDVLFRQLFWVTLLVALVAISWACCGAAYYVYFSGLQTAIFVGSTSVSRADNRLERTQESAQARATHQRLELVVSPAARAGISELQMSDLQVVLRQHSFVLPPPAALTATAPHAYAETGATTDDCAICLCTIAPREMATRLRCSHVYHRGCIETWLTRTATCPSCRASVAIRENDLTSPMQRGVALVIAPESNQGNQILADATSGTWTINPLLERHSAAIDRYESS